MSSYPRRKHTHVMRSHLKLAGARVADVGCGDGALVRFMTREGAETIGIDCTPSQMARARAAEPAGAERYVFAGGEALPLADGCLDIVVFFNSLHHVPVELQGQALDEARRVLEPGGLLFVMEPLAEGGFFELMRPVDDETFVRARATEALKAAAESAAFTEELEERYAAPFQYESFAACKANMLSIDDARRAAFEARESDLAAGFAAIAERRDGAFWFDQPSRLNLLRRV